MGQFHQNYAQQKHIVVNIVITLYLGTLYVWMNGMCDLIFDTQFYGIYTHFLSDHHSNLNFIRQLITRYCYHVVMLYFTKYTAFCHSMIFMVPY